MSDDDPGRERDGGEEERDGKPLPREKAAELLRDRGRREFLKAAGALSVIGGIAAGEFSPNDADSTVFGGKMALSQAYRLDPDGRHWIGPDSAKSNVATDAGRYYEATDTQKRYYADGSSWTEMGFGSSGDKVPQSYFKALNADEVNVASGGSVEGLITQAVEFGKVLADDGKLYDSIDTAENNATDWLFIGPGTFSETVTVGTDDMAIIGSGKATVIDGGSGDAIDMVTNTPTGVLVSNLSVKCTAGGGNTVDGINFDGADCIISNVWCLESDRNGIRSGASDSVVVGVWCDSANIDSNDIEFGGSSSGSVIDDIIGTVSDGGTGNTVGETA